jgi:hypothetical protein
MSWPAIVVAVASAKGTPMKRGEKAQYSARWWKESQPHGLATARRLESALHDYESAKHTLETHPTPTAVKAARAELASVETAVKAVVAEAARHKEPEMSATVDALRKLDAEAEQEWIASKLENEADDDDNSPFSADNYHTYLLKMLRRLRTVPMNFALVIGHTTPDHRLALHRVSGPMALGHKLVQETGIHLMTFGKAIADEDRPQTILLTIEGRQLPAIKKKLERMLRINRPLPFRRIALFAGGAEVADIDDENDHEIDLDFDEDPAGMHVAELREEIERIRPRLSAAMLESAEKRTIIMSEVQRFVARLKAGDLSGARAGIVALHAMIPGEGFTVTRPEAVEARR